MCPTCKHPFMADKETCPQCPPPFVWNRESWKHHIFMLMVTVVPFVVLLLFLIYLYFRTAIGGIEN